LPDPAKEGWSNMMYQTHLYDDDIGFERWTDDMANVSKKYQVAGFVGEFQNLNGINICNRKGISWTTWTYKGTGTDMETFFWYFGTPDKVDVMKDTYEEIIIKWGEPILTENLEERTNVTSFIKKYAATPIRG